MTKPNIDMINKGPSAADVIRLGIDLDLDLSGAYFHMQRHYDTFFHIASFHEQNKALVKELKDLGLVEDKQLRDVDLKQLAEELKVYGKS
tara:strand:- start:122 stop:391 length:270 start_codon:yes stop_codon:yes gene_type:complete